MELFLFPPLDSWTHESWLWVKLYHISSADSKHILPSEELCPSLPSCYHLIGAVTASSKGHSIFLSDQFRVMGNMVRPVDSMIVGPLHFSGCEMNSLVRCITVWDNMTMDEAFYKFMDSGSGRSIMCWKGKCITRISIYSSKNKTLSFPRRKWSNVVNLPPGCWLVPSRNGDASGAQCWSLLLADLAFSSSCSQVSLGEWKSTLLSMHHSHFVPVPIRGMTDGWGKRLTTQDRSSYLLGVECLFC